jgi:hypothetical protein
MTRFARADRAPGCVPSDSDTNGVEITGDVSKFLDLRMAFAAPGSFPIGLRDRMTLTSSASAAGVQVR